MTLDDLAAVSAAHGRALGAAVNEARAAGISWDDLEARLGREALNFACQWLLTDAAHELNDEAQR